jgi:hypothetical protein
MMKSAEVRDAIAGRLEQDLIGPDAPDEILASRPSDVYLTGILWPLGNRMDSADDDGATGEDEGDDSPSTPVLTGRQRPCTMGLSFATQSRSGEQAVNLHIVFATYETDAANGGGYRKIVQWKRRQYKFDKGNLILPQDNTYSFPLTAEGLPAGVGVHIRGLRTGSGLLSTVTILNRTRPLQGDRNEAEAHTLFQVGLSVVAVDGTKIVPRAGMQAGGDEDEEVARLLYRNCPEFATGHQCSAEWETGQGSDTADRIFTTWIPRAIVPAVRADGHDLFAPLVVAGAFRASELSRQPDAELIRALRMLPAAYGDWITLQERKIGLLATEFRKTAENNLDICRSVKERIERGISRIETNENMRTSFRLANAAIALQHAWKPESRGIPLTWRPFQLGFVLLAAESSCDSLSKQRDVMDLLWFPTGGGKTEAYLAIIAMLAFYRRLSSKSGDRGSGTAAVMRYTLRLLTAQQFERAASLILACDLLRKGAVESPAGHVELGKIPFSIGLWVGGDATPNDFRKAIETRGRRDGSTAEQIEECPCCQSRVRWNYDESAKTVYPTCENDTCLLGPAFGRWPVYTVDTDVYQAKPTLLIGTVDKFALLPTRKEIAGLFGLDGSQRPDLIIQDELHLISGPLGTIAGLYETAYDWLFSRDGRRPKVIGSTATIRRASEQIRNLFDRRSFQFPPPGIDHDDSGFAVRDTDPSKPGRFYLGVSTAGRSAKFTLQAVSGSLLQSGSREVFSNPEERDGYATLLCYFNSLRELGGAIVQMLDDVPDSIYQYAGRHGEKERRNREPRELTSRVSQKEIVSILNELKRTALDPECVDVVLATNMVSVGVDVPRLGLMVVNGQPKTRSEYIQATSRIGRSTFPGLVVSVLNTAKARDRSHFETFPGWHATLYRDVEATSVTPFASRARDRGLHAVLVGMLRHRGSALRDRPDIAAAPDDLLEETVREIERRISAVDPGELEATKAELDRLLENWENRAPRDYMNERNINRSLLQSAERFANRRAAGRPVSAAWPTMNNMRSVEPACRFRMAEILRASGDPAGESGARAPRPGGGTTAGPRWRRGNG